jgi:group I intron endonuclease
MIYYLYKITNLCNNKIYIGIHKTQSLDDGYMGSGKLLKAAIKKYGKENFCKDVLETFDNEEDMVAREQELVTSTFVLSESNYNIMPGGKFGSLERNGLSFKDKKHSLETITKIRNASVGRTHSSATRAKMSENNFSKTDPERQKEHAKHAGSYNKSAEHRKKISETLKKVQKETNPNLGKIRQKVKCPHCGKEGANNTMSRWHFNNCSVGV